MPTEATVTEVEVKRTGRPPLYTGTQRRFIAQMVRKHGGILPVVKILRAPNDSPLAAQRDKRVFPEPKNISVPTVTKIAVDDGFKPTRGRKAKVEATESVEAESVEATEANTESVNQTESADDAVAAIA